MNETRVAGRYAKSLLLLAEDKGRSAEIVEDMDTIHRAVSESKELLNLINSPIVKSDKKGKILEMIFKGKVSDLTMDFISILVRKGREHLVDDMAYSFQDQRKELIGTVTAEVVTAIPLTEEQRQQVRAKVTEISGGTTDIDLREKVDESIIGGIIIRVGDKQIDNSVARRLLDYKKEFSKNQYVAEL